MIITVDPSQSEDIAAFAMVKQYRMQALNVTLNGGTGVSAWQAVQGGEGYTQTVVTPVTGIELVYEDPNAIVSYTVENDDTSNYDAASNAGIILSSIEPTTNAWTYTCVFHADSVPVSSVDIDLLVYGNIARGTEQQGSPATAEEITAQVLAGLETRVTALEEEMPDKADVATTYTKTEADTLLGAKADQATTYTKSEVQTYVSNALDGYLPMVRTTGNQDIAGVKTFSSRIQGIAIGEYLGDVSGTLVSSRAGYTRMMDIKLASNTAVAFTIRGGANNQNVVKAEYILTRGASTSATSLKCISKVYSSGNQKTDLWIDLEADGNIAIYGIKLQYSYQAVTVDYYLSYGTIVTTPTVHLTKDPNAGTVVTLPETAVQETDINPGIVNTTEAQTISGAKTFTGQMLATGQRAYSAGNTTDVATIGTLDAYTPMVRTTGNQSISGNKTFINQTAFNVRLYRKDGHDTQGYVSASDIDVASTAPASNIVYPKIVFRDNNDALTGEIAYVHLTNGSYSMYIRMRNTDGSWKYVTLGTSDVIA